MSVTKTDVEEMMAAQEYGSREYMVCEMALRQFAQSAIRQTQAVPPGESRWLIERPGKLLDVDYMEIYSIPQRQFYTGADWSTNALHGARYPSKKAAEWTIKTTFSGEDFEKIEALEHLFQCDAPVIASPEATRITVLAERERVFSLSESEWRTQRDAHFIRKESATAVPYMNNSESSTLAKP